MRILPRMCLAEAIGRQVLAHLVDTGLHASCLWPHDPRLIISIISKWNLDGLTHVLSGLDIRGRFEAMPLALTVPRP